MLIYLMFLAPGILLAMWAQYKVQSAYSEASQYVPASGLSGAEAAEAVLQNAGVPGVQIEPVQGFLSDHYVPGQRLLRLSPGVYGSRNLAALGIAAHEAGHAIQDADRYSLLVVRNLMVPLANFGSFAAWIIITLGFVMQLLGLVIAGIVVFSLTVIFQLVNLPVEFDASRRARAALLEGGLVTPAEDKVVARVLDAAALTYVAATLTAVLTLLYFLFRAGLIGGRDE
jgi:Zn-dependent membrane protease YugP